MKQIFSISGYLAVKEVWRNRGRFLLVSLVIALITLLVLFIAALGEGLGNGNREYISKPVSYTHLTLPTIYYVLISVVAVSLKKKDYPLPTLCKHVQIHNTYALYLSSIA